MSERLAQARAGAPAFLLVEGEPGIGKTALLRQFVTAALGGRDGAHVLNASGDESESSHQSDLLVPAEEVRHWRGLGAGAARRRRPAVSVDSVRVFHRTPSKAAPLP